MSDSDQINLLEEQSDNINTGEKRVRSLTVKGAELYETERQKHVNLLKTLWKEIESLFELSAHLPDNPDELRGHKTELDTQYEKYTVASRKFVEFLERTNTEQSTTDLDVHKTLSQAHEQILRNTLSQLIKQISKTTEEGSRGSKSGKSRSSKVSNISSILAQKKATAVAAKTKSEYAKREADLKKKQAAVVEQQQLLAIQVTRQRTELEADIECLKTEGLAAEAAAEVKVLQSMEASDSEKDNLSEISLPCEKPSERTRQYVEKCDELYSSDMQANMQTGIAQGQVRLQPMYSDTHYVGDAQQLRFHSDGTYDNKNKVLSTDNVNKQPTVQVSLNPTATPFTPADNSCHFPQDISSAGQANEITNFLLRKELLLTRLHNFNDQPEQYVGWKSGFLCVIREIGVSDIEQLELLIRWLGPLSSPHARSLKAANPYDPSKALRLLWERLDERFGAPELIESALKSKLEQFPKLTNKDNSKLYELADILVEINSLKENEQFKSLLAYYDSSSGVLPIVRKLPYGLQEKWTYKASEYKKKNNVPFPPFDFFVAFVQETSKIRNDPSFAYEQPTATSSKSRTAPTKLNVLSKKTEITTGPAKAKEETISRCPLHKTRHSLNECRGFKKKDLQERKDFLRENSICFRCCASTTHGAKECNVPIKCTHCQSIQHTAALHIGRSTNPSPRTPPRDDVGREKKSDFVSSNCTQICGNQFPGKSCSKNILVTVHPEGQPHNAKRVYAIFDEQSNVSLGRSEFFDMFGEQGHREPYTISSCNGREETSGRRATNYVLSAVDGSRTIKVPYIVECDAIPDIRDEIPSPEVATHHPHLAEIASRIPPIDRNAKILLLIGRDNPEAHHVIQQRTGPGHTPYAQRLPLGWVIIGETCLGKVHRPDYTVNKIHLLKDGRPSHFTPCDRQMNVKTREDFSNNLTAAEGTTDLQSNVFLLTADDNKRGTSVEDRVFLQTMDEKAHRETDGNWTAPLPFRTPRPRLPDNRGQATKRAKTLHNTLVNNTVKRDHFFEFMGKILDAGHAELAPQIDPQAERWYLPLFGVYHPHKPNQIRGVFDSSAKQDGRSLNDVLLKGPDLTNNLLGILLRFRQEPIAITADIERMFYCFRVSEEHRDYLRFFWYRDNNFENQLVEYRMTVHVFGNSPSPAIATYGLRRAAQAGSKSDKDVVDFVTRNFYVDDALTSLPTVQDAIDLLQKTQKALQNGGNIRLHKIASNSQAVIDSFPSEDKAKDVKDLDLGTDSIPLQRSLGLAWDLKTDSVTFRVGCQQKPFTRRGVLSTINSLFDPIGFVAPIVIRGKILLRELMTDCADWDDPLPPEREQDWDEWKSTLQTVQELQIPRTYHNRVKDSNNIAIFCDASEKAIAAAAYLSSANDNGDKQSFILGKSKVAPLHGHTIPRLELCAAVLAVEVGEIVAEHLDLPLDSFRYFTDSKIVLGYLHNTTRRFHVYVSNRVQRVLNSSCPGQWGYVPSDKNPADVATRDTPIKDIAGSQWLNGSSHPIVPQTTETFPLCGTEEDKEIRAATTLQTTISKPSLGSHRFERFSTWRKLVEAIARLKHISRSHSDESACAGWHVCRNAKNVKLYSETETLIIKQVQSEMYSKEIDCILRKKAMQKDSRLVSLTPYLDGDGVLRVGGRLNRSDLHVEGKNPIIIPGRHHIATLLARHFHEATEHQGRHLTEGAVRSGGYWITGCKKLISSICHKCVKCRKQRAKTSTQIMADIPADRLTPAPPFTYVAVDAFGHWTIVTRRTRGGVVNSKRWAIVFSCLVSRAIHIEVVEEMTASAFINALRRFFALRGKVKQFRSDRGTNFVGAVRDLGIRAINVEDGPVNSFLYQNGVEWIFNPPHSSHMGGSWERMIGLIRRVLDSMLTGVLANNLTHDVLVTFMAEVCAVINARPLGPVGNDPECPFILSPSTLLTQKNDLPTQPPLDYNLRDMYTKQWKRVQLLAETFWRRWRTEYLHTLQPKRKWTESVPNVEADDVVLLKDKELPRNDWAMGVIQDAIPGEDGKVRKCVVRVNRGGVKTSYTRPISEIVLLIPKSAQ